MDGIASWRRPIRASEKQKEEGARSLRSEAAPPEIPTSSPSSLAERRAISTDSSKVTVITSSIKSFLRISGTKPAPIPWILCGPGLPPESTGLSTGSTATILNDGFFGLMYSPTPVSVPPVPTVTV